MNKRIIGFVIFFLFLCILPAFIKREYWLHVLIMSGIWSILCMGWALLLRIGLFSLGQAAFLGIGAYASAIMCLHFGVSFWIALPLAGVITAIFAFVLGVIILRLKGIYFAVVTFAFGEFLKLLYYDWVSLFGGIGGLSAIPRPSSLFDITFTSKMPFYYVIIVLVVIAGIVIYRIDHSRLGRISRSIGNNTDLAQSQGMNPMMYKVICFVVAAFFAGIAGSFMAHYYTNVSPDSFAVWESIMVQIKSTVGGVNTVVLGPILGAVVMTIVGEFLRGYMSAFEPIFFGVFLILVVFFVPGGLASMWQKFSLFLEKKA